MKMSLNENKGKQTVFKENGELESNENDFKKTSSGLEQNIAGLLCYLVGFITGIIFLLIEKENLFVRYHAMQSIIVTTPLVILSIVLRILSLLGLILGTLFSIFSFIL